jgi:hypothetical protein
VVSRVGSRKSRSPAVVSKVANDKTTEVSLDCQDRVAATRTVSF